MRRISVQRWLICLVAGLMIVSLLLPVACAKPAPAPAPPPAPAPTPAPAPAPAPPPAPKVFEWDYASGPPANPGSYYDRYSKRDLPEIIEKATNGRLKITHHEGLVPAPQVIDAVRDRTVDMGCQTILFRGEMALHNYLSLPVIPNLLLAEMHPYVKPILMEVADKEHDVIQVGYGYWGKQLILANIPLPTLEDLKKVKIRTHSVETLQLLKAAGGSPVSIPMGELYLALQRGVADGAVSSLESFEGRKLYETAKYVNFWPMGNASYAWFVNKQAWAELPADLQAILLKTFAEEVELQTLISSFREDNAIYAPLLKGFGCEFIYPEQGEIDKLMALSTPIIDDWKARAGPRAEEVLAIVNRVLAAEPWPWE